ncbi:hypothetical protein Dda_4062 [Drechslerella dactyloides]|uniref:Uncharacterized protein n=1 Tax=Drechslerella dactyloides TaxID=74499 RepID=A0AAD6IZX8_DREDA|nr:hypothetical protein Dda_4062 [Drechslerella dactyloides]
MPPRLGSGSECADLLMEHGADPNAVFFRDPMGLCVKMTPWMLFLASQSFPHGFSLLEQFLNKGANLERTILVVSMHKPGTSCSPERLAAVGDKDGSHLAVYIVEVNARFLLEYYFRNLPWYQRHDPHVLRANDARGFMDRPDVQASKPYRRPLLIRPGTEYTGSSDSGDPSFDTTTSYTPSSKDKNIEREAAESKRLRSQWLEGSSLAVEVGFDCSEILLEYLDLGSAHTYSTFEIQLKGEECTEALSRTARTVDVFEYLENLGYYKSDQAAGPEFIPMFEPDD